MLLISPPRHLMYKDKTHFLLHTDALGLDTGVGGCLSLLSGVSDVWIDG